jgi:uncharacterized protein (TIGR02246 family)
MRRVIDRIEPRRNLARIFVIVMMLAATMAARPSGEGSDSVADAMPSIQRANTDWAEAMKRGDADVIAEPYAIDGVFIAADGTSIRGRSAIRDLYRARLAGKAPIVSASIERRGVAAGDRDLVYEWGSGTVTSRSAAGALEARGGAYLTVWKRRDSGRWEIIRNIVL